MAHDSEFGRRRKNNQLIKNTQPVISSVTHNLSFLGVWRQSKPVFTFDNAGALGRILVGVCYHDNSRVSSRERYWIICSLNMNPANCCTAVRMTMYTDDKETSAIC